jgi:translation initiation factor 4A
MMRQPVAKVLVVYDVQVKTPEVSHVPLIINYGELIRLDAVFG